MPEEDQKNLNLAPDKPELKSSPAVVSAGSGSKAARHFLMVVVVLLLIVGLFVLATNGAYYYMSQETLDEFESVRQRIHEPAPDDSTESRTALLDRYVSAQTTLPELEQHLTDLDDQFWTFAVLIRSDYAVMTQNLIDRAERGQAAIQAYLEAADELGEAYELFVTNSKPPATAEGDLEDSLAWYLKKIDHAADISALYQDLLNIPDLELAGPVEAAIADWMNEIDQSTSGYSQPVQTLSGLIEQSKALEVRLDALYARNPDADNLDATLQQCDELIQEVSAIIQQSDALSTDLPEPLVAAFDSWRSGQLPRKDFVMAIRLWWQHRQVIEQSLESAKTDRATAKRYIEDSLAEENVETAYLWTQTAEGYKLSMQTALDFANIYIARTNDQLEAIALNREAYRPALGYDTAVREIAALELIDPDAFWLTE